MKRTLVTGGTGFIGQNLVERLIKDGEKPVVIRRPASDHSILQHLAGNFDYWTYDGSYQSLEACFSKWDFETVYHLAAHSVPNHKAEQVDDIIESNITFGVKLAEAMTASGVKKFINIATSWQYYHSTTYRPLNLYASTKMAFEDVLAYYADARGLQVASVILFDTYGSNDRRAKLWPLLLSKKNDCTPIELSPGEQLTDLTHVDHIVDALLKTGRLLDRSVENFKRYIAATGKPERLKDAVENFCKVNGLQPTLLWGAKEYRDREVFEINIYEQFDNLLDTPK
jgi:nucleoside-diphosphate-sugar epimerase